MGATGVGEWLVGTAVRKGAVQAAASAIALVGIDQFGGVETTTVEKVIVALVIGLVNVLRNWLKVKVGLTWL